MPRPEPGVYYPAGAGARCGQRGRAVRSGAANRRAEAARAAPALVVVARAAGGGCRRSADLSVTFAPWLRPVLLACAGAVLALVVVRTQPLLRLDLWTGDHVQRLATPPLDVRDTVIVEIDDESLARLRPLAGEWPYGRDLYARVVDYLTRAGAKSIVLDVLLAEPRTGDGALAAALAHSAPVTLAAVGTPFSIAGNSVDRAGVPDAGWPALPDVPARTWADVTLPRAELASRSTIGIVTLVPDEDGVIRRVPTLNRVGRRGPAVTPARGALRAGEACGSRGGRAVARRECAMAGRSQRGSGADVRRPRRIASRRRRSCVWPKPRSTCATMRKRRRCFAIARCSSAARRCSSATAMKRRWAASPACCSRRTPTCRSSTVWCCGRARGSGRCC